MNNCNIYKIKDSVDLFLSDDQYIMAYYMNTRQRKSFKINKCIVPLIEQIDGKHSVLYIKKYMEKNYNVDGKSVDMVLNLMLKNRLITNIVIDNNILSREESERFKRQINYFSEFLGSEQDGINAQKKLMDTNLLIFGCGAIGGDIATELVMARIGKITLYDYDIVEKADASRHMYFREQNIGKKKVNALKEELLQINSKVIIETIDASMHPESNIESIIEKADFVVNTLDEPYIGYTSAKISRICVQYNIPHYIAGGFDAHLASTGELIIPYITPCVECYAGYFKEKLKNWKPKKHPVLERYNEIGGLSSLSLFSAAFASIEIVKYISGLVEINDNFKARGEFLFTNLGLTYLDVKKNPNCPVCGGEKQ